ncbi:hypothetical protein BB561_004419 [Smittium simulii]|nr:hypothetical protein BB561_004419 [Smittium simulii]
MGLDRLKKTPCGFCFVEYYTAEFAYNCVKYINGTKLDDRMIRTDLDPGFKEGRQFGRGKSGGQVRDEHREEYDKDRGGWGHIKARYEKDRELGMNKYEPIQHIPTGASSNINSRLGAKKRGYDSSDDENTAKRQKGDLQELSEPISNDNEDSPVNPTSTAEPNEEATMDFNDE